MKIKRLLSFIGLLATCSQVTLQAAGTLTPSDSTLQPMKIQDHHVEVMINNGFAQTEVTQIFHNPKQSNSRRTLYDSLTKTC